MVIAAMIALALSHQAGPDRAAAGLACSLATPGSAVVDFVAPNWDESGDEIGIDGSSESVWPRTPLVGRRHVMTGSPGAGRMFAFGAGNGLALEVAAGTNQELRSATLYRRDGRRVGLPLAFGFCAVRPDSAVSPMPDRNADSADAGANIAAFDPARWPAGDCGLVLSDGRRVPFRFMLPNREQVRLWSPELWANGPVTMAMRWYGGDRAMTGSFARSGGPSGRQAMAVSVPFAARLIRLWQIGGPTAPGLTGFGICGMQLVRRAD
jgi:hypothetical protein